MPEYVWIYDHRQGSEYVSYNAWREVRNQKFSRTGWGWEEMGTLINISLKTQEKETPQGNILKLFLLNTLKATFWMENLTQNGHNQGLFSKIRALYSIFMGMGSPVFFSIVTHLWVWLKLHQNLWICLNIPENVWINCFGYARALNMHDHLKYSSGFLRYLGL